MLFFIYNIFSLVGSPDPSSSVPNTIQDWGSRSTIIRLVLPSSESLVVSRNGVGTSENVGAQSHLREEFTWFVAQSNFPN